jgi:hypothetical protein
MLDTVRRPIQKLDPGWVKRTPDPGAKVGRSISDMAMLMTLRWMGRDDLTVHGFRSTFKD